VSGRFFPDKPEWDVQTLRVAAQAAYGGSDFFECLEVARSIEARGLTEPSWREGWAGLAERLTSIAARDERGAASTPCTRAERAGRASSYFRTAEFFAAYDSPVRRELFDASRNAFREAIGSFPVAVERIEIPDGDVSYEGYVFHRQGDPSTRGAGVVFLGGADSYAEELFFFGGLALAQRGMTVVVADTPGRGSTLRHKGVVSRPDYEVPAARLLDFLAGLESVDESRMGLVGLSLGGYYAPRLAGVDRRVKALVCWCACFDVLRNVYLFYPPIQPQLRWIVGAATDEEARARLASFNLESVAGEIECPILISHGEADQIMALAGARELYDAVSSKDKTLRIWTQDEGGAGHCNYDNWATCVPLMFDWLAERLNA
jgi:esterase/lipase